ncbi:hypothetical protein LTS08_006927 [Lithohypha guttulata]|nr:hypothetical protein LTS08_006927 [Lithohypha guttulata]
MAESTATPSRRVLPARQRGDSAAKRRASSPLRPTTPASITSATPLHTDTKAKKRSEKKTKVVHVATPTRSTSTPISTADEILPTRLTATRPLPTSIERQSLDVPDKQYQTVADSAILAASLHRSRMQWLCDGVFKKYWTKPIRRKKAPVEEPVGNPDVKSMQKLGNATLIVEPHTFEATFYVVRETSSLVPPVYRPANTPMAKPIQIPTAAVTQPSVHAPVVSNLPSAPSNKSKPSTPAPIADPSPALASSRPTTPPGGAKATDPVIQMLANRAATDNHLKELMKVVAQSKANPDQLREFQAHIDEFNAIVKRQQAEKQPSVKSSPSTPTPMPTPTATATVAAHPTVYRQSPLNPTQALPQYTSYPTQPRPEPLVKHIVIELNSVPVAGQSANSDRWLFPEYAVLDTQYGGTEMTCSFFVERKGSDILASMKDLTTEEAQLMSTKWKPETEYYEPVTIVVRASNSRTIATIASAAKPLPEVQKYMQEVVAKKARAPREYLVYRLPRDKVDLSIDFVDSAVELSAEDDELKDYYPL